MRTFTQKWAFLLMVVLFGCCLQVNAQSDLTVADGTSTSSYLPLYGLNADTQGMKGQCLYPADSLTDMAGGSISQITFYCGSTVPAEVWGGTFIVYLGETDESNLSSAFISTDDLTAVYTGTLDATSGTLTIEFDDAYTYQGGNLVVDVTLSVTGNWKSATFLGVNNLTGSGRYRTSGSGAGTATAFLPKAEFVYTPGGSAGPTCDKPESVEANDVTANSATINWVGTASAYNLQYKASSDADWTLVKNLSGNSYALSNLVSNTAYQVQVQAICGENTSGWKSASFNTLIGLPYAENFSSTPAGWNRYTGTLNADGSAELTATTSYWTFGTNNGVFDSHANIEVYGARNAWLVTPAIPIPELEEGDPGYHMFFNLALTYWSGANVPAPVAQADARFVVLASNDGGSNWNTIREWNNTGSEYVFDNITCSAEGEEVDLDLTGYAGQTIKLAFYLYHNSGGDNRLHVDNFLVEKIPTCLKPTGLHTVDGAATSSTLPVAWTANSGEENWRLQYKPAADAEAEWITLDIAANPYTITGLSAFTEYEIRVAAVCTEEDFTDYGKSIKAKTAAVVPFAQTFDTTAMPGEWKRYEVLLENVQESDAELVPTKDGWNVGAKNGVFGNEHLYLNIKDSTDYWLVSPVIEMQAGYQLTFDLALTTNAGSTPTAVTAGEQNDDQFIVFISTNGGADWTALGTWDNGGAGTSFDGINTEGQTIKLDLSAYASNSIMLAFYGESTESNGDNNLHISNVAIAPIPACERPLSITVGAVTGTTAEITWDADEDGTWEYGYKANPAADFVPTNADYTETTTEKIAELSELAETTDYLFFVRRACSETEKSEPLTKAFKTIQTPAQLPYNGDFEEANGWLSFHGEFANEWVRGTAVAKGGTHALYISNDGGETAAYAHGACVIYATKTFYFPEAGMYSISFDWLCNGESTWDYMRVALVPTSVEVEASSTLPSGLTYQALPEGWTALDGGSKLNLSTTWQTQRNEINIEQLGYYKVVLVWRNDGSGGTAPGGAIDNFNISRLACRMPNGLELGEVTANSAAFSWNDDEDGMTWQYACLPAGQEPTEYTAVTQNSLLLENLAENTKYTFYLRKDCGDTQSEVVTLSFKTVNPYQITVNEGTSTNSYIPMYAYYADNHTGSQFITPAAQLADIQWDSIKALTFYTSSLAAHDFGEARFDIYVGIVENTTLSANVPFTSLTKVVSNKGLTIEDKMMYIEFDQMYQYQGGNLLVALNQITAGDDVSTTWLGVSASYGSARYEYNSYGPYSGSFLPKMSIDFKDGEAPACTTPTHFAALDTTATTTSIELTWTPVSPETTWAVRYREQGAQEWEPVVFAANDTFLLEGLNPSTIYEAEVATQCDPEDATAIGAFSDSIIFATECVPFATVNEDFEGSLVCWSVIRDGNGYPVILSNYPEDAHSGSKFGYFASQVGYDPVDEYVVLPELISLDNMRLKFYACNDVEEASENATLVVGVMPTQADSANFVALDTIVLTSTTYGQFVVPFTEYTGDNKFVAIKMLAATTGLASARLEDVVVEAIPSCMEPAGLAAVADSLTDHSAVLAWTPQGDEANWLVRYRKLGAEEWNEPILATNDSLLIEGLEMGSTYEAQVAAWCDPENEEAKSPYSGIINFRTLCGNITTLPWRVDFENMAVNSIPTCWDNSASSSSTLNSNPERIFGVYEYGGNKMLRMYNYYVSGGTALINTPSIVLPESPAYELSFDYAHTATCGAMTIKISVNGGEFTALTPTYGKTSSGTDKDNPGEFTTVDINLSEYAGDTIQIQFFSTANYGSGAIFVDNVNLHLAPTCLRPTDLAISDITVDGAKATWANEENGAWLYAVALASAEMPAEFIAITDTFVVMSELLDNKDYIFYLRKNCGDEGLSEIISATFHTLMAPAAVPYADDFEDGNNWMFINGGMTNAWAYGEAAHNGEGTHALYVSNDKGASNAYTNNSAVTVYAVKIFEFEEGIYNFQYDWKANGESTFDYLRVALVPDSIVLEASSTVPSGLSSTGLPAAWHAIALDGASKLNLVTAWQTQICREVAVPAGTYKVVFLWRDDTSGGSQTPAAVDNFIITKITCKAVSAMKVSGITASSATIGWTKGEEDQDAWQLVYTADPEFDLANVTDEEIIDVASNTYALAELITDTLYTVYVRANCGDEDGVSTWATTTFRTAKACQTPDDLAAADITYNSAKISWYTYDQTGFNLRYIHGTDTILVENVESPYVITDLAPATTYLVQVQAACEAEDAWEGTFTFKTHYAAPFSEAFATTSLPTDWSLRNGLMADILSGADTLNTNTGYWLFGSNNGVFDSHARINIYGTARKHWLLTPAIYNGGNNQLSFDLALTLYSGTLQPVDQTKQLDDKFAVLVSANGGQSWTVLREWNNSGSAYVYNNIATAGEEVILDLTAYAGQEIIVAFYGESTVEGGDNNLHIDNVHIEAIPTCAKPQALTVSDVYAHTAILAWTSEAAAWEIALDTIANFNPDTLQAKIAVTENPYTLTDLLPNHNYYVYVRANCGEEDGNSVWTARQSFKTTIACPAPSDLKVELTEGDGSVATLTWKAGAAQAWQVEYSLNSNMSDSLVLNVTEPVANLTGLTAEAKYYARVKADCGELDGQSVYSAIISFLPTDIYSIVVNDGTNTNSYVPIYGTYVDEGNTASQFIVPASELEHILWDSITTLTFHASTASADWGAAEFEVYMAPTEAATLDALVNWDNLTQVMVAGNLSIVGNKMVVTLSEHFQYTGENLLIGFKQTVAGSYVGCSWYGKNTTGASIGGYGTGNNMAQRNFLPKMTINYVPGEAPACMWATHIEVSEITAEGATFAWDAVEDANWEYAVVPADEDLIPTEFAEATNPLVLDNLEEATSYIFYLRNNCGEENSKLVSIAFQTIENIESLPYNTIFAENDGWKLANDENGWVIADNQLFISNDGEALGYDDETPSVSYATKLFDFVKDTTYTISYEWKCVGELDPDDGALDFMRVALVPAEVELIAGVTPEGLTADNLPQGWIALDTMPLLDQESYVTMSLDVEVPVGQYRIAFIWINDQMTSNGDPAAINSLSIGFKKDPTAIEGGAGIESKAVKFLKNNHVYIRINDRIYDATGRRVE